MQPAARPAALSGVGPVGKATGLCLAAFAGVIAFGLYAYAQQIIHGESVTGMSTIGAGGAAWGLYVAFYVFFIGVSFAGVTIASLIRLFGIADLKPLARIAELLTIICLLLGAMIIVADLGRPLQGLLSLPRLARPMSPFFGTFTMVVGGYLFASLVYFFLAGRADAAYLAAHARRGAWFYRLWASGFRGTTAERHRHRQTSFWMSLFILPLLVTAHSTLGFIFGIQAGRPGWYGALQAPSFVVMAGVSGIGVLIVITALIRRALHLEATISLAAFRSLGTMLWVLVVIYLYFMIAEELTMSYAASTKDRAYAHEIVFGAYAPMFWTVVGTLVLGFVLQFGQFVARRTSIPLSVAAGLSVNVAAVLKRYLLVVPSQTHGMLLPYDNGAYSPSWVELGVVIGLVALGIALYVGFVKIFPIIPGAAELERAPEVAIVEPAVRRRRRAVLTSLCFVVGLGLALAGFVLSARVGTQPELDPLIPFSPVIFITGLMMIFSTAAVYETIVPPLAAHESVAEVG
jgi:Ni/Fe-hydrogenase subunit HybB-like protein